MKNKEDEKMMPKWLVYTLFLLKFVSGLGLIWWTVYMTLQSDVGKDNDNAFLSDYHQVDDNYNKIIAQNNEFTSKYNVRFIFNNEIIDGLTLEDVYLSQRVIQERKIRKNIINVGTNKFSVLVQDKNGNKITEQKVEILVTKNTTHKEDVKLLFVNEESKMFEIYSKGYWNITGTVEVDGTKGTFYIKTNGKKYTK